jgi:hypothetical protein
MRGAQFITRHPRPMIGLAPRSSRKAVASGTARVDKVVAQGLYFVVDRSQRPAYVQLLDEYAYVVPFGVGLRALVQALEPIAHQLRLAQLVDHPLLACYCLLSFSVHDDHLRIDNGVLILRPW